MRTGLEELDLVDLRLDLQTLQEVELGIVARELTVGQPVLQILEEYGEMR